jgi:hypothetical protein
MISFFLIEPRPDLVVLSFESLCSISAEIRVNKQLGAISGSAPALSNSSLKNGMVDISQHNTIHARILMCKR